MTTRIPHADRLGNVIDVSKSSNGNLESKDYRFSAERRTNLLADLPALPYHMSNISRSLRTNAIELTPKHQLFHIAALYRFDP